MSENEDRRIADQAWKLEVTKQLATHDAKIDRLVTEQECLTGQVQDYHGEIQKLFYGSSDDKGLTNKYLDLVDELENIKKWCIRILPWLLLICIVVGDRLSPLIFDWIYEKTHIRLFYSPVQEFKEEKQTVHIKHYHIHVKAPEMSDTDNPE